MNIQYQGTDTTPLLPISHFKIIEGWKKRTSSLEIIWFKRNSSVIRLIT